jgi:hypothetical protein
VLPQLLAGLDVQKRQGEEDNREQKHRCILHRGLSFQGMMPVSRIVSVPDSMLKNDSGLGCVGTAEGISK